MNRWQRECLDVAREHGVVGAAIHYGGKHPTIIGTVAGRPITWVIKHSGGTSWRAPKKARSDLRRLIRAAHRDAKGAAQ